MTNVSLLQLHVCKKIPSKMVVAPPSIKTLMAKESFIAVWQMGFHIDCYQNWIDSSTKIKIANKNFLYLSFRWYGNQHPLNLAIVELPGNKASPSAPLLKPKLPKLKPFPSWEVQKLGDCSAIQFVQSMQVNTDKKSVENIFVKVTSIWTRTLASGGGGGRSCLAAR